MSLHQEHSGGGPDARCGHCGALAVGPCARCRAPVCGDCCVLTEGGASVWAVCLRCRDRGGASLGRAWLTVAWWLLAPLAILFAVVAILAATSGR